MEKKEREDEKPNPSKLPDIFPLLLNKINESAIYCAQKQKPRGRFNKLWKLVTEAFMVRAKGSLGEISQKRKTGHEDKGRRWLCRCCLRSAGVRRQSTLTVGYQAWRNLEIRIGHGNIC